MLVALSTGGCAEYSTRLMRDIDVRAMVRPYNYQEKILEQIDERSAQLNAVDPPTGRNALHVAMINGNLAIIVRLIEKGVDVNLRDKQGCAPLDLAEAAPVVFHDAAVLMMRKGLSLKDDQCAVASAFMIAARQGDVPIMSDLVARGAKVEDTPAAVAELASWPKQEAYPGLLAAIQFLVDHGASVNAEADGLTPLAYATIEDNAPLVAYLRAHGANVGRASEAELARKRGKVLQERKEAAEIEARFAATYNAANHGGPAYAPGVAAPAGSPGPAVQQARCSQPATPVYHSNGSRTWQNAGPMTCY
jgi:ankyrin repeat protein